MPPIAYLKHTRLERSGPLGLWGRVCGTDWERSWAHPWASAWANNWAHSWATNWRQAGCMKTEGGWAGGFGKAWGECLLCRGWGRGSICALCVERLATPVVRCEVCALRLPEREAPPPGAGLLRCGACLSRPPAFFQARAAVDYCPPWAHLVKGLKWHGQPQWAKPMAGLMQRALQAHGLPSPPDTLLPMPASPSSLRRNGVHHSWELCRALAKLCARPSHPGLLKKWQDTASQHHLTAQARRENLRKAFAVCPLAAPTLRGQHLMLVDDVMTTGASAGAAAQVLLQAGAALVSVCVFARTPSPAGA
jgi:ComF family protein